MESLSITSPNVSRSQPTRVVLPKSIFKMKPKRSGLYVGDLHNLPDSSEDSEAMLKKISMAPIKARVNVSS